MQKKILKETDIPTTANFLDEIKVLGYNMAFKGGLSFSLGDIIVPQQKNEMIDNEMKTPGREHPRSPARCHQDHTQ